MTDQPKPTPSAPYGTMAFAVPLVHDSAPPRTARRVPGGPRQFATRLGHQADAWPLELEVEPWRP